MGLVAIVTVHGTCTAFSVHGQCNQIDCSWAL